MKAIDGAGLPEEGAILFNGVPYVIGSDESGLRANATIDSPPAQDQETTPEASSAMAAPAHPWRAFFSRMFENMGRYESDGTSTHPL
jgi:hypothetical protein